MILCFSIFKHFWFPLPVRSLLLKSQNHLLWEKYCNYPLTATWCDRFVSCENIVSRSQTSSLPTPPPPPPWLSRSLFFLEMENTSPYFKRTVVIPLDSITYRNFHRHSSVVVFATTFKQTPNPVFTVSQSAIDYQ